MMHDLGHEVYLYGGTENEARCSHFVTVMPDKLREELFGHYDWDNMVFADWDPESPSWSLMNHAAIKAIKERASHGDFLCIISGICQSTIRRSLPNMRAVEWGIGYEGIIHDAFHVFESMAWMHWIYGKYGISNGRFFDTVIPNSFDPEDYVFSKEKGDYLLYLGRLTSRKGMEVVHHLAQRHKLLTAGQGSVRIEGATHCGVVRGKEKAELLANAKAVVVPTFYIEPFGGVAVEAMMSGTPVLTTDFGAFTETVVHGQTGFRCSTLGEFIDAVGLLEKLDPCIIMQYAKKFATKEIAMQYEKYFKRLQLLDGNGWYTV